jgi:hypothetical protein
MPKRSATSYPYHNRHFLYYTLKGMQKSLHTQLSKDGMSSQLTSDELIHLQSIEISLKCLMRNKAFNDIRIKK